jgi:hypothetical protein
VAAAPDRAVQYNDAGSFGGSAGFTFEESSTTRELILESPGVTGTFTGYRIRDSLSAAAMSWGFVETGSDSVQLTVFSTLVHTYTFGGAVDTVNQTQRTSSGVSPRINGGNYTFELGNGAAGGTGGTYLVRAGAGGPTSGPGGQFFFITGNATGGNANSGSYTIDCGFPSGTGTAGVYRIGEDGSGTGRTFNRVGFAAQTSITLRVGGTGSLPAQGIQSTTPGAARMVLEPISGTTDVRYSGRLTALSQVAQTQSTSATINWTTGHKQRLTMTGNVALTFTAPEGPTNLTLVLVQDGTGGRSPTWPASTRAIGAQIQVATNANAVTVVSMYFDGTNYWMGSDPGLVSGVTTLLV